MRDLIARIARALGWVTWYHVAYQWPNAGSFTTCDGCFSVRPWLRQGETFKNLRDYITKEAKENGCTVTPNIISITRIGA